MVAVVDCHDVAHVVFEAPETLAVGSTWCAMDIDYGYPAPGRTVMWVERTARVPTCLECLREVEHRDETPVRRRR